MGFQWYAIDERGFVAEVGSADSPLPPENGFDLYETMVLEYAVYHEPAIRRRLYQYREVSGPDRVHVRTHEPDEPLSLEELGDVCALAATAVRYVEVDFDRCDAFIPEEIVERSRRMSRQSAFFSKDPVDQAETG
jgi:hypothetical protein